MIKPLYIVSTLSMALFGGSLYAQGPSPMHHMQQMHPDSLSREQRVVMHRLSPKYQHIYLYVLDDEERDEVVRMYRRGDNPYRVINCMLQKEHKEMKKRSDRVPPSNKKARVYDDASDRYEQKQSSLERKRKKRNAQMKKGNSRTMKSNGECKTNTFMQRCRKLYPCGNDGQLQGCSKKDRSKKCRRSKRRCSCRSAG